MHRFQPRGGTLVFLLLIAGADAMSCWDSATQAEDTASDAASAARLRVWQFRGITPGITTANVLLADERWGPPLARQTMPGGQETWHYPVQEHEAIVILQGGVVQVVDLKLSRGVNIECLLQIFKFKEASQSRPMPPIALLGSPLPADWKPRQMDAARVVVFVEEKEPVFVARMVRFYGPDPLPPKSVANSIGMTLRLIPAGRFRMGSPESGEELETAFRAPQGRFGDEQPQHEVRISRPFYMAIHEVTVGQYRQFIQETNHPMKSQRAPTGQLTDKAEFSGATWTEPGFPQNDSHPVVSVSWEDAVAFCRWLSKQEDREYRLPTEAEWEYACRAGTTTKFYHGDAVESLVKVANVLDLASQSVYPNWTGALQANDLYASTSPVGRFQPNSFGLYDMHGNVWEWCQDWYDPEYYSHSPAEDPPGPNRGNRRLFRGGCWY